MTHLNFGRLVGRRGGTPTTPRRDKNEPGRTKSPDDEPADAKTLERQLKSSLKSEIPTNKAPHEKKLRKRDAKHVETPPGSPRKEKQERAERGGKKQAATRSGKKDDAVAKQWRESIGQVIAETPTPFDAKIPGIVKELLKCTRQAYLDDPSHDPKPVEFFTKCLEDDVARHKSLTLATIARAEHLTSIAHEHKYDASAIRFASRRLRDASEIGRLPDEIRLCLRLPKRWRDPVAEAFRASPESFTDDVQTIIVETLVGEFEKRAAISDDGAAKFAELLTLDVARNGEFSSASLDRVELATDIATTYGCRSTAYHIWHAAQGQGDARGRAEQMAKRFSNCIPRHLHLVADRLFRSGKVDVTVDDEPEILSTLAGTLHRFGRNDTLAIKFFEHLDTLVSETRQLSLANISRAAFTATTANNYDFRPDETKFIVKSLGARAPTPHIERELEVALSAPKQHWDAVQRAVALRPDLPIDCVAFDNDKFKAAVEKCRRELGPNSVDMFVQMLMIDIGKNKTIDAAAIGRARRAVTLWRGNGSDLAGVYALGWLGAGEMLQGNGLYEHVLVETNTLFNSISNVWRPTARAVLQARPTLFDDAAGRAWFKTFMAKLPDYEQRHGSDPEALGGADFAAEFANRVVAEVASGASLDPELFERAHSAAMLTFVPWPEYSVGNVI